MRLFLLLCLMVWTGAANATEAIGSPAAGCVRDAQSLDWEGQGYQIIRQGRGRNWSHPVTIAFIRGLAAGQDRILLIGDLGQGRGGPMPSGHASHQNGMDVDIWFRLPEQRLKPADLESPKPLGMVNAQGLAPAWSQAHADLLERAARAQGVDRIFVNPVIKRAMCQRASAEDRDWLRRLRPWWGHDEHFHVRMTCPPDSPLCEPQLPVPDGDGCGDELASWLDKPTFPAPPERPHVQRKPLPEACAAVLGQN